MICAQCTNSFPQGVHKFNLQTSIHLSYCSSQCKPITLSSVSKQLKCMVNYINNTLVGTK